MMATYTSVVSLHRSSLFIYLGPKKLVADLLERTWFFQLLSHSSGRTSVLSSAFVFLWGGLFPVSGCWKGCGRWVGAGRARGFLLPWPAPLGARLGFARSQRAAASGAQAWFISSSCVPLASSPTSTLRFLCNEWLRFHFSAPYPRAGTCSFT